MARSEDEQLDTDQRIRRGAVRTLGNVVLALISVAVIGGWISTGFYSLELVLAGAGRPLHYYFAVVGG